MVGLVLELPQAGCNTVSSKSSPSTRIPTVRWRRRRSPPREKPRKAMPPSGSRRAYVRRKFGLNRNAVGMPGGSAVVEMVRDEVTGVAPGTTGSVEKAHRAAVGTPPEHFKDTPLGNVAPWGTGLTVTV